MPSSRSSTRRSSTSPSPRSGSRSPTPRSAGCRGCSTPTTSSSRRSSSSSAGSPTSWVGGARSSPGVRDLHARLRAVRGGPDRRAARRGPRRAGPRRRDARAGVPGPRHRRLPRGAARPRHRALGRIRRASPPGSARPSAACSSSWVAGAGPSSSTCPSASRRSVAARSQLVESRAPGRRRMPDLVGCGSHGRAARRSSTSASSRAATGAGRARRCSAASWRAPCCSACSSSARVGSRTPLLDPALLRLPSFAIGSLATVVAGFGFYAYLLTNILWLTYVWGYDVLTAGLALVPGALIAAVVAARLGPLAERYGYRVFVVPGALVWAGAYLWYHQMVGLEPAFWSEWLPGQVLSGIGVGATLPAARQREPRGRAREGATPPPRPSPRALASSVACSASPRSSSSSASRPRPPPWTSSTTGGCSRSSRSSSWRSSRRRSAGCAGPTEESDDGDQPAVVHAPAPPESWLRHRAPAADDPTDLSDVPLLTALPPEARHRLERAARLLEVPAGTVLIREGDPPGSAFVVRRGRLEVEVAGRVVRELGAGEVIGEIALLTGERRSAAVRARRDSTVLEIPREAFEAMLDTDPGAARVVLGQVADRLRTAGGPPGPPPPERLGVVSVVAVHEGADAATVADRLVRRMGVHVSVAAPGRAWSRRAWPGPSETTTASCSPRGHRATARTPAGGTCACARRMPSSSSRAATPRCPRRRFELAPANQPELVLVGPAPTPGAPRGLGRGHRRAPARPSSRATPLWTCARSPTASPGGRSGSSSPAVARGPSPTSGCCASSRTPVCTSTGSPGSSIGAVIAAAARDRHRRRRARGAVLPGVGAPPAVQRLAAAHHVLREGPAGAGALVRDAGCRHRHRGNAAPAAGRRASTSSRAPARCTAAGSVVDAAQASAPPAGCSSRPMPHRRRPAARRRRRPRQPPDRPPRAARRGTRSSRSTSVRAAASDASGRPRVPALGETLMRTMMIGSGGAVEAARSRGAWVLSPVVDGGRAAGVPPAGPHGRGRPRRRPDAARAGRAGPRRSVHGPAPRAPAQSRSRTGRVEVADRRMPDRPTAACDR